MVTVFEVSDIPQKKYLIVLLGVHQLHEQSKAALRRRRDWHYTDLYYVGAGIDVGAGSDGLSKLRHFYPKITSVRDWDVEDGDAQFLADQPDCSFDFVSASHVLEHLKDPVAALSNWCRVLKVGGHAIITVPEARMYERGHWPSLHAPEHKHCFEGDNIITLARWAWGGAVSIERFLVLRQHFDPSLPSDVDQTMGAAECAIELVLKRI